MVETASRVILQAFRCAVDEQRAKGLTDQELLQRFTAGRDETAFHILLRRHGPMVLGVCRTLLPGEADAEDAFQATFLVLARRAASIRKTASLGSWLHGVAYRTARKAAADFARRRKHERIAVRPEESSPEDRTWREVQGVLHEELNGLSERYRAPLTLCYLEGKTQDEAAAQLGLSKGTLKARLERAREVLRARLVRRGLGPAGLLLAAAWPASAPGLPIRLSDATVRAVVGVAGGQAAAEFVGPQTVALTEGVLKAMLLTNLKTTTVVLAALALAGLGLGGLLMPTRAREADPKQKQEPPKVVHERVKDRRGEEWSRVSGKVKVIDAATLEFEDGTRIKLDITAPHLDQMGRIGDSLYPCGKDAAEFLRRFIADRPVTCIGGAAREELGWSASVGDTALNHVMITGGWALASQKAQRVAELTAWQGKRGLWRGQFIDPEDWEAGARLPGEPAPAKLADEIQAQRLIGSHGSRGAALAALVSRIVKDLPDTRRLSFEGTGLTDAQLAQLAGLKALESLDLFSCGRVTDAGLAHLKELPRLKSLRLPVNTTDAGLEHVGKLTTLDDLFVGHWLSDAVTDAGLSHLKGLRRLRHLTLYNLKATDEGLRHLRGLDNLAVLEFGRVRVTDAGVTHLKELGNLQYLDVSDTAITDAGAEQLIGLKRLRVLKLPERVTAGARKRLREALPELTFEGRPEDVLREPKSK